MIKIDTEHLKRMSVDQRHQLWKNASKKAETSEDAKSLVALIESSNLDYAKDKQKSVSLDDPIGRKMKRIIGSAAGTKAMLEAVNEGLPALAGVEPLLQAELGNDYNKHNEATVQAGYLVTGFMQGLGYEKVRSVPLPSSCVARSGLTFRRSNKGSR